jgi:hypothetical protein
MHFRMPLSDPKQGGRGVDLTAERGTYFDGNTMIVLKSKNGSPWATLSVNLPKSAHLLKSNEFFAKTWSENEEVARWALLSECFRDTGMRVPTGFVEAQIWEICCEPESYTRDSRLFKGRK